MIILTKKDFIKLLQEVCILECEYLQNQNADVAKRYNNLRNKLLKNKKFYHFMIKTNIYTV